MSSHIAGEPSFATSIQNGHKQDGTRVQGIPTLLSEMPKQACVAYWHWSRLIAKAQTEYVKDKLTKAPAQCVNVQRNVLATLNQALIHPQTGENLSVYCTLDMVKVYVRTLFLTVDAASLLEDKTGVWRYRLSIGVLGAVAWLIARDSGPPTVSGQLCAGLAESMKTLFSAPSTESSANPAAQPAPPSPALADVIPRTPTTKGNKKPAAKKQLRVQAPEYNWRPADKWSIVRSRDINLGRTHDWLSRVIRPHDSRAANNTTFNLPREARKWSESDPSQIKEGLLRGVYRAGRQCLIWARPTKRDQWFVEPLTSIPLQQFAAVCRAVQPLEQEVGDYIGWLVTQNPSKRLPNKGFVELSVAQKWAESPEYNRYIYQLGGWGGRTRTRRTRTERRKGVGVRIGRGAGATRRRGAVPARKGAGLVL